MADALDAVSADAYKWELHRKLQRARATILARVEGLSEYDMRRPMTPTGTNLLGLLKHLAGCEYGYFGECFDRMPDEPMPWTEESIWAGADMWATADETSEYIISFYRRACAHSDATFAALDLHTVGHVDHWPPERRQTTLGFLMIHMLGETSHHAGHADIIREAIDGVSSADVDDTGTAGRDAWVASIRDAAESFRDA